VGIGERYVLGMRRKAGRVRLARINFKISGAASTMTIRNLASGFLLVAALSGCQPESEPQEQVASELSVNHSAPAELWAFEAGEDEVSLRVPGPDAKVLFWIGCMRSPARLEVVLPGFAVIASEERLTLGLDDEAFALVADVVDPPPSDVRAETQISPELLDRFSDTRAVSAVYGATTAGPYPAPSREQSDNFVAACRGMAS
jgi:hypothetical protein